MENTKLVKEKKGKKTLAVPESVAEEMDMGGGDDEFGIDQRTEVLLEISEDALTEQVVEGPVEALSVTFLQDILSDGLEMGEEYDLRVQEVVQELEEPCGEAEREYISSRDMKEELIEMARDDRKGGDGKMSSESTEETERIIIEDSSEGDSFMVRGVGLQHEVDAEQPEPPGETSTPPRGESTPMDGQLLQREESLSMWPRKNSGWNRRGP